MAVELGCCGVAIVETKGHADVEGTVVESAELRLLARWS